MLQRLDLGIPGGQQVPQPRVRMAKLLNQLRSGYLGHNPRSSPSTPEDQASPLRQRAARIHPQPRRSHPTREWTLLGLVGAAGATLLTSTLLGIPAQLVDPSEAKDTLRSGPELSVGVEITQLDDEGLSKVVPGAFQPSAHARQIISQSMGAVSPEFLSEVRSAGGIN